MPLRNLVSTGINLLLLGGENLKLLEGGGDLSSIKSLKKKTTLNIYINNSKTTWYSILRALANMGVSHELFILLLCSVYTWCWTICIYISVI